MPGDIYCVRQNVDFTHFPCIVVAVRRWHKKPGETEKLSPGLPALALL